MMFHDNALKLGMQKTYKPRITYIVIVAVEWLSVLTVKAGRLDAWWFCTSPKAREQNVVQHYMDPSVNALNPETLFLQSLPQPNWSELHGLLWEWLHDVSISRILLWFCMDMASECFRSKSIMPYLGGWRPIYQLFWVSPRYQVFDHLAISRSWNICKLSLRSAPGRATEDLRLAGQFRTVESVRWKPPMGPMGQVSCSRAFTEHQSWAWRLGLLGQRCGKSSRWECWESVDVLWKILKVSLWFVTCLRDVWRIGLMLEVHLCPSLWDQWLDRSRAKAANPDRSRFTVKKTSPK